MSEGLIERVLEDQFNSRLFSKSLTQRNLTFSILIIAQINTFDPKEFIVVPAKNNADVPISPYRKRQDIPQ